MTDGGGELTRKADNSRQIRHRINLALKLRGVECFDNLDLADQLAIEVTKFFGRDPKFAMLTATRALSLARRLRGSALCVLPIWLRLGVVRRRRAAAGWCRSMPCWGPVFKRDMICCMRG